MANDQVPGAKAVAGAGPASGAGRGHWGSRLGFVLAAAGSAVGLGNIWKFPYITGENGGGLFVLIYLGCIALIGLPVMIGEIMIGRRAQKSPAPAFTALSGGNAAWSVIGWMGVLTGFLILSFYSVVAGWSMHYIYLSLNDIYQWLFGALPAQTPAEIADTFGSVYTSAGINIFWHAVFMVLTVGIVIGGIKKGIETGAKILMPTLFVLMGVLLVKAMFSDGFSDAAEFLFAPNADKLSAGGVLEALGHSFFTLSLGMGALITYGSYLRRDDDIVIASGTISLLDTGVALVACMVLFPIIFSFGMEASAGPGLVFINMPVAFSQMTAGPVLSLLFFALLLFAALTSAISLLEVVVATIIDQLKWDRLTATLVFGGAIFLFGIPSALSGAGKFKFWEEWFGKNFFDSIDYLTSNWFLPLGGLFVSIFVGWIMPANETREEFETGSRFSGLYGGWLFLVRYIVPVAIMLVFLYSVGVLKKLGIVG